MLDAKVEILARQAEREKKVDSGFGFTFHSQKYYEI